MTCHNLGCPVGLESFVDSLEDTLMAGESDVVDYAIAALSSVIRVSDAAFLVHVRRIGQLLTNCHIDKAASYRGLRLINDRFGTASAVYVHFPALLQAFIAQTNVVNCSGTHLTDANRCFIERRTERCFGGTDRLHRALFCVPAERQPTLPTAGGGLPSLTPVDSFSGSTQLAKCTAGM